MSSIFNRFLARLFSYEANHQDNEGIDLDKALAEQLAIKEYEALRKEISDAVAETRAIERYAITAIAGIWTWIFTRHSFDPSIPTNIAVWFPFLLACLAAFRCEAIYFSIQWISEYLKKLKIYANPTGNANNIYNWEYFVTRKRNIGYKTAYIFWRLLIGINFILAIAFNINFLSACK